MATTVTTAGKTVSASALKAVVTHMGLLDSSGNEFTNSGYARQAITWGTATSTFSMSGTLSFTVSGTVGYSAGYSAVSGGTKYIEDTVEAAVYATPGVYMLDTATVTFQDPA